jgi:hypothetical protein
MQTVEELSVHGGMNIHGNSAASSTFNPFQNSTQASSNNTKFPNPMVDSRMNKFPKALQED